MKDRLEPFSKMKYCVVYFKLHEVKPSLAYIVKRLKLILYINIFVFILLVY